MIRLSTRPGRAGYPYPLLAFAVLVQTLGSTSTAVASDGRGVAWRTDLGAAQAESRARDLPLWIQFTGPWCVNCRRMDWGTFSHPMVVDAARERFVAVKLRSDEYEQLALSLGLSGVPSTVIVRPNGEVIDKWEGYGEPGELLVFLEGAHARFRSEARYEVALGAHCPVSLVDRRRLVPGRAELVARRDGFEYHFADEAARRAFLAEPEKYVPANRGECPVRHVDAGSFHDGDPRWGVLYKGHLYLCAGAADRERFLKNPERYANLDADARAACHHCWSERTSAQVAGNPSSRHPAPSAATRRPGVPARTVLMEALLYPVGRLMR
jgi:YHS domain-containing protein